jgi:endonuclease G
MVAPQDEYSFDLEVAVAAAERWSKRGQQHAKFEQATRNKQYSELDTADRRAARANRLLCKLQETNPREAKVMAAEFDASISRGIVTAEVTPETVSDDLLERVIGKTRDFQFVEFLEQAVYASKAVGRVVTKLGGGRVSYGTGFMVSPRLLMTNHHVLTSADIAVRSTIEFDYQRDRLGRAFTVRTFKLDPAVFFLNDKELDFALVAVSPNGSGRPLQDYGWCPLIKDPGKIVAGEPINIVQHPKGEMKQVVIRENRLIDTFEGSDLFYQYEADTEPGSSGSPVFNDQWEVVALHHSGVPKRNNNGDLLDTNGNVWRNGDDPSRLEWVANEGIRVSKLVEFISKAPVPKAAKLLVKELLDPKPLAHPETTIPLPSRPSAPCSAPDDSDDLLMPDLKKPSEHSVTLTIPLHITFSLGGPGAGAAVLAVTPPDRDMGPDERLLEKIEPDPSDPDYETRPGYNPEFLGFKVAFPRLTNITKPKAYAVPGVSGSDRFELKYHHYSLIFNKDRKLAFAAGVNYDPTASVQFQREGKDRWFYDPRVTPEKELQVGNDLYADNPLDRGHLVRRADAAWGSSEEEAKLANDDTFHFTNCSPQHAITNQGKLKDAPPGLKLWGKLEDHVATQGKKEQRKLCVFNGPVFRTTDTVYRGVKIPQEFWKIVVFANDAGDPAAAAFVLTQAALIQGLEEEFQVGEYKAVQVRVKDLETKTGLDFGRFRDWDVIEREGAEESFTGEIPAIVLEFLSDMVL